MNLFEKVKEYVSVKQAAEYYGLKVNRGGMVRCPFHNDRNPSMKVNERYYFCFGCGAKGDVIDLVAELFALSNYEAVKKIAYDFGISPDDRTPMSGAISARKKQEMKGRQYRQDEMYCQRVIFDYLHLLRDWQMQYSPCCEEEEWDERFEEAYQMRPNIENLADILLFGEIKLRETLIERLLKDGMISGLEKRMERLKGEMQHGRKKQVYER